MNKEKTIKAILNVAKRYGDTLFSGNCGMFAWAAATKLKRLGFDASIGLIANGELLGEPDVFHVWFNIDNLSYDASGIINLKYLKRFMKERYPHKSAYLHSDLTLTEQTRRIISTNTDWNINWTIFYREFSRRHHQN